MATTQTIKTASVLAFERKLDPSDALFLPAVGRSAMPARPGWPSKMRGKSVRGTISNRLKTKDQDPAKLDAAIENPNLQTVDVAALPADADTLKVSFTLRVLGGTGKPSACNSADYQTRLLAVVQSYADTVGFGELARRYAHNLANGRFLWRNRLGAEQIEIHVAQLVKGEPAQSWTFDALTHSLREFDASSDALNPLAALLEQGLAGSQHVLLRVTAYLRAGAGQEVFPSQELILDKEKAGKSKTLYHVNNVAAMHSQKSAMPCEPSTPGIPKKQARAPSRWSPTDRLPRRARPTASPRRRWISTRCSMPGFSRTRRRSQRSSTM